jgi:DNA-binding GntR family transcriptional regulator
MPISRASLREQVRDELLRRIGSGQFVPGDHVSATAIAAELGVSSIPVREATRELVAMGILDADHNRGCWVREVSIPETIQALEVRAALESLAARLAAPALETRIPRLRELVAGIVDAAKRRDFVAFQQENQAFHREIVEASGNRILLKQWQALAFDVRTRAIMDYLIAVDPVEIAQEHGEIVDAFEAGDAICAAALLAEHSGHLMAHLRKALAAQEPVAAAAASS